MAPLATEPPLVGEITAPVEPQALNTPISASAVFTDSDLNETHTALWDWGDGSSSQGVVNEAGGSGSVTGSHSYAVPGVYTLKLTLTDSSGLTSERLFNYVVVYDPAGGFVTGGAGLTPRLVPIRLTPA